ncbi:uncharacterized protein [Periplaneta americana]|uniref:uncharacterized protein n=1 Tax=Periplaneta americana TaxID=6978 RepID=UPI0037E7FCE6
MATTRMQMHVNRCVAVKVGMMAWSSKRDLILLSSIEGEVMVYNLSWKKIWTFPPPSEETEVTGLAWRPDGNVFAIGYSKGDVVLVDAGKGEIIDKFHVEAKITCIKWVEEGYKPDPKKPEKRKYKYEDSTSSFLLGFSSSLKDFKYMKNVKMRDFKDTRKINEQLCINMLIVADNSGRIHFRVFGVFPCGVLKINEHFHNEISSILDVGISEDLSTLFVVLSCLKEKDQSKKERRELTALVVKNTVFTNHAAELYVVALSFAQIMNFVDFISRRMKEIREMWKDVLIEIEAKLSGYASRVPQGTVSADFLDLLAFGTASKDFELFLLDELAENNLKRLNHSVRTNYLKIQKLMAFDLHAAGQDLALCLSELLGTARCEHKFGILGFEEDIISESFRAVGAFLVKTVEVQNIINRSLEEYNVFFGWLHGQIKHLIRRGKRQKTSEKEETISARDLQILTSFLEKLDGLTTKQEESCSSKQEESCSSKQEESCSSKQEESCSSRQEESCSSKQEESCSSKQEENCSSKQEESCSSKQEENFSLRQEESCSSKQEESCSSKQEESCSSKQEASCSSKQEASCSSRQEENFSSRQEESGASSKQESEPSTSTGTKSKFNLQYLGQYFEDKDLDYLPDSVSSLWSNFVAENSQFESCSSIIPHCRKMSLIQQCNHFKKAIDNVFCQPEVAANDSFMVTNIIKCSEIPHTDDLRLTHVNVLEDKKFLFAFLNSASPAEGFYLMEVPMKTVVSKETGEVNVKCVNFYFSSSTIKGEKPTEATSDSSCMKVSDLEFYSNDILSALLERKEDGTVVFVQIPMKSAVAATSSVAVTNQYIVTSAPRVDASAFLEEGAMLPVGYTGGASKMAVCGVRYVIAVLSESCNNVKLFELETVQDPTGE